MAVGNTLSGGDAIDCTRLLEVRLETHHPFVVVGCYVLRTHLRPLFSLLMSHTVVVTVVVDLVVVDAR
jgi:hypothetical protein